MASTLAAPACASCVLGATSTSLLSFSYQAIQTIEVRVDTYVAVLPGGSRSTSYESHTLTGTEYVGSGEGDNKPKTFNHPDELIWTVGDATLTYPTTYVQYLGFEGAPVTTDDGQSCANPTDASAIPLPSDADTASLIYPLDGNSTQSALPPELLAYLGELPDVAAQFGGEDLAGCSPLNYVPETSSSVPPSSSSSSSEVVSSSSAPMSAYPSISSKSGWQNTTFTKPTHTITYNTRVSGTTHHQSPDQVVSSSYAYGSYVSGSAVPAPTSYEPPAENTHQTAFVIQPISGKSIVTTQTAAGAHSMSTSFH